LKRGNTELHLGEGKYRTASWRGEIPNCILERGNIELHLGEGKYRTAPWRGEIPNCIFLIIYILSVFVFVIILFGRTDVTFVIITSGEITAVVMNFTLT